MTRPTETDIREGIARDIYDHDGPAADDVVARVAADHDVAEADVHDVFDRMEREGEIYAADGRYHLTVPEDRTRGTRRGRRS